MNNDILQPNNPRNGKVLAGVILLAVGGLLLIKQLDIFPDNIQLWPLWLVGWGLYIGVKSNYRKPSAFLLMIVGGVLLIVNNIHGAGDVAWPIGIIAFGLWMILRRHHSFDKNNWKNQEGEKWKDYTYTYPPQAPGDPAVDYTVNDVPPADPGYSGPYTGDDYLDAVSVFGSVKKTILSKHFRGGEIVNIFGGAELDFTQADINGKVFIDITQIFGGVKMIVPPHWQVVSDIAAVFAGIDDKRLKSTATAGSDKILVLKGVSIFAGVDIRSF
ncbi:LiaF domain-containing protein [Mucilaginibacter sp. L3T2-6]|uniref:LiaF transmembrane domain-containing protein n=1 Tax=Mucilaginibacter sp. L3T2-6 TaxID=3062491 RepID=UPI002675BB90|nr:LiaF domain-containing protein [Mucilaginibacter sp. L3T2-6]MDO3644681.1 LiaF-related protein [Mucilaginibacter sp. L3T2-6]MDV6217133.1 LiaF-related protein [Mucilaginibacter sp. L3T2-6]